LFEFINPYLNSLPSDNKIYTGKVSESMPVFDVAGQDRLPEIKGTRRKQKKWLCRKPQFSVFLLARSGNFEGYPLSPPKGEATQGGMPP
jgi:hypothetical protein